MKRDLNENVSISGNWFVVRPVKGWGICILAGFKVLDTGYSNFPDALDMAELLYREKISCKFIKRRHVGDECFVGEYKIIERVRVGYKKYEYHVTVDDELMFICDSKEAAELP